MPIGPTDNPIVAPVLGGHGLNIDPDVTYDYVIVENGGNRVTVDDLTDFEVSIVAGSDTGGAGLTNILRYKFTGTPTGLPTPYPINITVTKFPSSASFHGTTTQVLPVTVFNGVRVRNLPNITSPALTKVGLNAAVSYTITADMQTASLFAQGLPAGLTCDFNTGRITGTPPAVNATYLITLGAIGFGGLNLTHTRYWVLVVGTGSDLSGVSGISGSGAPGFLIYGGSGSFTSGATAPTSFTYSGTFNTPSLVAGPIYERPFEADPARYLYHVQYRVALDSFTSLAWDAPGPYGGIHVGESQWKNERGGILTFWRTFALVPAPRDEFESHLYGFQFAQNSPASTAEIPKLVHSKVHYDYIKTSNPVADIPIPEAPHFSVVFGQLYHSGEFVSPGQDFLAENSSFHRWKGNIYERRQRFITMASLGAPQT